MTQQDYTVTVTRAASDDATLSDLTLTATGATGLMTFDADTTEYTDSVPYATATATVAAPVTHVGVAKAVITPADADEATDGVHEVNLNVGENLITVTVTAEDKSTQIYTVTVTRAAADAVDATLSVLTLTDPPITLDPAFVDGTTMTAYTASVPAAVDKTTVMATATLPGDSVVIAPATDADADIDGHQVALGVGDTTITVTVTHGTTTRVYTVTVTRIADNDASLTALTLREGEDGEGIDLSPKFDAGTTAYTASVPNDLDDTTAFIDRGITVTATTVGEAMIRLITPGTEGAVNLDVGENLITVTVVAADGSTQQVYTVTVTRAASSDATLSGLTLDNTSVIIVAETTEYGRCGKH